MCVYIYICIYIYIYIYNISSCIEYSNSVTLVMCLPIIDFPVAQMVKHLPTMWENRVRSLGSEDPLEKEMTTRSSILAWKIPWMEEPGRLQSMGSQRVAHDFTFTLNIIPTYHKNFVLSDFTSSSNTSSSNRYLWFESLSPLQIYMLKC